MNELSEILKGKKGSDTFLEYAEPYLLSYMQFKKKANIEEIEKVLKIPWMIWNASVLSENTVDYMASIRLLSNSFPAEIKAMIEELKIRKETLFSQYNYLFSEYHVYISEHGEIRLSMETRSANH